MKLWRKQAMAIGRAGNDGKRPGRQIKRMNQMGDLSIFTPIKTYPLLTALFERASMAPVQPTKRELAESQVTETQEEVAQ